MGFSVPGAVVILFVGLLVSMGTLYPVLETSAERSVRAHADAQDRLLRQQNTNFAVVNATYDATDDVVIVYATNTGTSALSIDRTDSLIDGVYADDRFVFHDEDMDSDVITNIVLGALGNLPAEVVLWLPGETIAFVFEGYSTQPARVTLVVETGLARGEPVVS